MTEMEGAAAMQQLAVKEGEQKKVLTPDEAMDNQIKLAQGKIQGHLMAMRMRDADSGQAWGRKEIYVEQDPMKISEWAFMVFRLIDYQNQYEIIDPNPTGIPHARHFRALLSQRERLGGKGFLDFITEYMDAVKHHIWNIHYSVLALATRVLGQPPPEICLATETQLQMYATLMLEAERVLKLHSDITVGMFSYKQTKDEAGLTHTEVKPRMLDTYAFMVQDPGEFYRHGLGQLIKCYREALGYSIMATHIQAVFATIIRVREQKIKQEKEKEKEKGENPKGEEKTKESDKKAGGKVDRLMSVDEAKAYTKFVRIFSPFINDDNAIPRIGRNHHRALLERIIHQVVDQFAFVFDNGRAGNDFCEYEDGLLHAELKALVDRKAPKTIFRNSQYLPYMCTLVRTVQKRTALKGQLCIKKGEEPEAEKIDE